MVETRSGVRIPAKGPIKDAEQIQQHSSGPSPENIDSDEDEIPCVISPSRSIDPSIRSLDHRRNRNQQSRDDLSLHFSPSKRRKTEPLATSRDARSYPTRASPVVRLPSKTVTSGKPSRTSSPEDAVPPGLVNSVNAAFKKKGRREHQRHSEPANSQLKDVTTGSQKNETVLESAMISTGVQSNHNEKIGLQEPLGNDHDSTGISGRGKSSLMPVTDHEEEHKASAGSSNDGVAQHGSGEAQSQADIWDVPMTPVQQPSTRRLDVSASGELPARARRIEVHIPQRGSQPAQLSQTGRVHNSEHPGPVLEGDRNASPELGQSELRVSAGDVLEDAEAGIDSGHIDGLSSDDEDLSDFDFSENGFAQDLAKFRARYPRGYKDSEIAQKPQDDLTTHLDPSGLRKALQLMGHDAWSGKGRKWHERPFYFDYMQPGPVRTLLKLLTKLERLLVAAPKAPLIEEQNKFFDEHNDLLSYYFSKISGIIHHIRKLKPGKKGISRSQRKKEIKKHDQMAKDIASLAIPMLFHVLASAWWLGGGKYGFRASFTISTIELLMRTLGWIGSLYRPLLRAQRQQPDVEEGDEEDGEDEETAPRRKYRSIKRQKREELEGILNELKQVVEASPDMLEKEEDRRNQEYHTRQELLERQEEVKAKLKQDEELRMMAIREQQRRSLLSLRGVHIPLSQSRLSTSTRESSAQELSQIQTRQNANAWSVEEKTYLFKKIQESYPNLLDLDDVRWSLDRTLDDTEAMAEELLGQMLETVRPEQAAVDRNAHVQEIMQNYRRTWGH
ncbi:hypothetical protein F4811DRAFT_531975 [Daldinia bambusicola]|nr:hypothetical protein F4811DRAFT_531975 [Daldinia bambusicola]